MGQVPEAEAASSKFAAIVIDANTGETLFADNADARRYPASLTKMMTLYLTFESMASGKISKDTRIPFSRYAASKPPTKLGVKPGDSITVETAIYALVTKSANDAAAAIGELLGGSESRFAQIMTAKARALGMSRTTFRNASGLPDPGQVTTARDMAILGVALREHFPQYYDYFSARSFEFRGRRIRGHNRLLGRIQGVDGIKTGYIRASGFNLVTSVKTGGKKLVAVVMGGRTGRSRDDYMAGLIRKYLPRASTHDRGLLVATTRDRGRIALPRNDAPTPDARPQIAYAPQVHEAPAAKAVRAAIVQAPTPKAAVESGIDPVSTASTVPSGGWAIQVASMPSESEAIAFLSSTKERAGRLLADAASFTETFDMKGTTYYRARFGGFDSKDEAWDVCGALKKKDISCYAIER